MKRDRLGRGAKRNRPKGNTLYEDSAITRRSVIRDALPVFCPKKCALFGQKLNNRKFRMLPQIAKEIVPKEIPSARI
jgi:hypothetical protein